MSSNQWVALIIAGVCIIALYTRIEGNKTSSREEQTSVTGNQIVPIRVIKPDLVSSFAAPQRARLAGAFAGLAETLARDANAEKPWLTTDYQAEQLVVRSLATPISEGEIPDGLLAPLASELKPKLKECLGGGYELTAAERAKVVELLRGVSAQFGGA